MQCRNIYTSQMYINYFINGKSQRVYIWPFNYACVSIIYRAYICKLKKYLFATIWKQYEVEYSLGYGRFVYVRPVSFYNLHSSKKKIFCWKLKTFFLFRCCKSLLQKFRNISVFKCAFLTSVVINSTRVLVCC